MRSSAPQPSVLALTCLLGAALPSGCGDDGVADTETDATSSSTSTTAASMSSTSASTAASTSASSAGTDSDAGSDSEASTSGVDLGDCADEVGPGLYECPDHATLEVTDSSQAACVYAGLALPDANGLFAYCLYFDMGYMGFGWDLAGADPSYMCPAGMRYAPNDTVGYCLYEDIEAPVGATADCDALLSEGRMRFTWTCAP